MSATSFLYDQPGPRARRRTALYSALVALLVLASIAICTIELYGHGQFDWALWSPLVNPGDFQFATVWKFLGAGAVNSVEITGLALVFSIVAGMVVAVAELLSPRWFGRTIRGVIELVRAVPVVILIFLVSIVLPQQGVHLPVLWYMVIAVTLHNAAVIAVIMRAGVSTLPRGQAEAAYALGLSRFRTLLSVLLPQACRVMLPALATQLIMIVKESTLGFIVSVSDFLHSAQIAVQALQNPIQMYLVVALVFVVVNYGLSALSQRLARAPGAARRSGQLRAFSRSRLLQARP